MKGKTHARASGISLSPAHRESGQLKLSAAICGESSVFKRNNPFVYARLPSRKLRELLADGFKIFQNLHPMKNKH